MSLDVGFAVARIVIGLLMLVWLYFWLRKRSKRYTEPKPNISPLELINSQNPGNSLTTAPNQSEAQKND